MSAPELKGSNSYYDKCARTLNVLSREIYRVMSHEKSKNPNPDFKPFIVAYVGHSQYVALMTIEYGTNPSFVNDEFMGVKIIRVEEDDYMHVVVK